MSIANLLLGIWFFTGVIYRGENLPRPNPDLQMQLIFLNEEQLKIHYSYVGERGFCESLSNYEYDNERKLLHSKVIWLNPENSQICSQDPDMQLDSESTSEVSVIADKLYLKLNLGEEDIVLIWE